MQKCTWDMFDYAIRAIANTLKKQKIPFDGIYGLPRGGLIPAVALSHQLKIPLVAFPTRRTLIVDDICDNGFTLEPFKEYFSVCLYHKENGISEPSMWVYTKYDDWVLFPWETEDTSKADYLEEEDNGYE